jgi:hypothetical protein
MVILKETERIHEILGPIRYEDGKGDPSLGIEDCEPFWLARPGGWESEVVEILLSGDSSSPAQSSLDRAVQVYTSLEKIDKAGRDLIRPIILNAPSADPSATDYEAYLSWIDCQQANTTVIFVWIGFPYVNWIATLNEKNDIIDLRETYS